MKKKKLYLKMLVGFFILFFAMSPGTFAQDTTPQNATASNAFTQPQLDQMLAPIALYPDDLLSQILMAATYPLEVVEAARWANDNKNLSGNALATALAQQSWDPSVKSLVNFPQVLNMMNTKLDWTQQLGDAMLGQQKAVMATVQNLRQKANVQGTLKSTPQQKVIVEKATNTTIIEPANPSVVYVPVYNPTVVYGSWWYPQYPPYAYYPPGYNAGAAIFSFAAGVALGAAWGYAWGGFDWHNGNVNINVNKNINYNRNIDRRPYDHQHEWHHDPNHRHDVPYRDRNTADRYNKTGEQQAAKSREEFRNKANEGGKDLTSHREGHEAAGRHEEHTGTKHTAEHGQVHHYEGATEHHQERMRHTEEGAHRHEEAGRGEHRSVRRR